MPAGVYLHIPFCRSRCSYCDFATDVYRDVHTVERYVDALCKELIPGRDASVNECASMDDTGTLHNCRVSARNFPPSELVDTIYFGGGTPSLLNAKLLEKILAAAQAKFTIDDSVEITIEMNPATVSAETLNNYRSLGINRASFGVQTFNDRSLKLLARSHNANDAHETFQILRDAGFDNISFDLIAGLPHQTLKDWERNLNEAIKLAPEHLSLYLLEIHEGTPLAEQIRSGRQPMPDEELAARMYEMMLDKLAAAGYEQYEISNFSRPGFESRHNSKYWRLEPVYGFGVSAHSFDGFHRYSNERDTAKYVELIEATRNAEITREIIDAASEFAFLGLRLNKGIDLAEYQKRFSIDLESKYANDLNKLKESELIDVSGNCLKLTKKGMLFSNEVFAVFV